MSEDLAAKLLAAIEEAEELAHQCERVGIGTWSPGDLDVWGHALGNNMMDRCEREHITRHDPAAVLRRCAADRKIVERYLDAVENEHRYREMWNAAPWTEANANAMEQWHSLVGERFRNLRDLAEACAFEVGE